MAPLREDRSMPLTATPPATEIAAPAQLHSTQHVDSHSIKDAVIFGMKFTIGCFIPLGLLIGNDRAPGSYYTYGLSCFIWPMISCIALGAMIGGSLGYVFGAIGHASDPVSQSTEAPAAIEKKVAKSHHIHLSLHSHRH